MTDGHVYARMCVWGGRCASVCVNVCECVYVRMSVNVCVCVRVCEVDRCVSVYMWGFV